MKIRSPKKFSLGILLLVLIDQLVKVNTDGLLANSNKKCMDNVTTLKNGIGHFSYLMGVIQINDTITRTNGTATEPAVVTQEDVRVVIMELTCSASFPTIIIIEKFMTDPQADFYKVSYTNFYNHSTYTFSSHSRFLLVDEEVERNQAFVCQSIHDPCLQQRIFYNYGVDGNQEEEKTELDYSSLETLDTSDNLLTTEFNDTNNNFSYETTTTLLNDTVDPQINDTAALSNNSSTTCPALFYYEEKENPQNKDPIYGFRCGTADKSPGEAQQFQCLNKVRCEYILRQLDPMDTANGSCWNHSTSNSGICPKCKSVWVAFGEPQRPFIPSCLTHVDDYYYSYEGAARGSLVYFGVPHGSNIRTPPVEFGADGIVDYRKMIYMKKNFEQIQQLNSTIQVTCISSKSYTAPSFQWTLQFFRHNQTIFQLLSPQESNNKNNDQQFLDEPHDWEDTINLTLNDTTLTLIHCLTPIQHTFEWINASRSILVVEPENLYEPITTSCQEKWGQPPRKKLGPDMILTYRSPYDGTMVSTNLSTIMEKVTIKGYGGKDFIFRLSCSAPQPIQLVYDKEGLIETKKYGLVDKRPEILYRKFFHRSTYQFRVTRYFAFNSSTPREKVKVVRCQLMNNPCIHQSLKYSYANDTIKFDTILEAKKRMEESLKSGGISNKNPNNNDEEDCQVIFYYSQDQISLTYNFRCEFPWGRPGNVKFHYCDSAVECPNLYRNRRQPKICWRNFTSENSCSHCPEFKSNGYRPFVATCEGQDQNLEGQMVKNFESTFGSFIFFGVPTTIDKVPKAYFENTQLNKMESSRPLLYLEEFDEFQNANVTVSLTCRGSAYFYFGENLQIAFQLKGNPTIHLISDTYKSKTSLNEYIAFSPPKLDPRKHTFELTRILDLMDYPGVHRVYCMAITMESGEMHNFSAPITVQEPMEPQIRIDLEQPSESDDGKLNIFAAESSQELKLVLDSKSQYISCHAFGYPPPEINWATTSLSRLDEETVLVNPGHRLKRIKFPQIHRGIEGVYICTADNKIGRAKRNVKIAVVDPIKIKRVITIVATVGGPLLAIFGAIVFILRRRNKNLEKRLRNFTPQEIHRIVHGDVEIASNPEVSAVERATSLPLTCVIPEGQLIVVHGSILGKGQFGIVFRGFLGGRAVAVKTVQKTVDTMFVEEFIREIKIMAYLGPHPNVVQFLGADVTKIEQRIVYGVVELSPFGKLENVLRAMSMAETNLTLLMGWCQQIAKGMEFLEYRKVIHADLSTRNILLFDDHVVKITDFGLSRQLYKYSQYNKQDSNVPLPVGWMAIESLRRREFSHKSDVWSFGVTVWEIFSLGQQPFPAATWDDTFMSHIESGEQFLHRPYNASSIIYEEMKKCWNLCPQSRPTFEELTAFFKLQLEEETLQQQPNKVDNAEVYQKVAAVMLGRNDGRTNYVTNSVTCTTPSTHQLTVLNAEGYVQQFCL